MTQEPGGTRTYALLEHVPEMVTVSDRRGRIVYANPATERVSGFAPEEFASLDPFSRMHPEDRPRCEEAFAELLGNPGLSLHLEHRARHKDGSWRWVELTVASLLEDPEVGGLLATVRDVTERKEGAERQAFLLKLSDVLRPLGHPTEIQGEACRLLAERLDVARAYYVEVDETAGLARVGRDFVRDGAPSLVGEHPISDFSWSVEILGRGECHVVSDTQSSSLVPPADRPASAALGIIACMGAPLVKAGRLAGALCVTDPHPREWSEGEVDLLREVGERIWAAMERARAEEALRESEERHRLAVEAADLGRWELVPETGGFRTSPTCNRHLGLPENARPTHEGHFRTIHPDDHPTIRERLRWAIEGGGEFEAEYRVIHPSGGVRRILSRARMLRNPGSDPDRLTGVTLDVTEARELEQERERARARELSAQVEAAERERISRELHDRVAHTMAVAYQSLELFSALATSAPERAREKLDLARETTRTALDQTRDLSSQLARRQTQETRDGLTSALRELLETHLPEGVEAGLSATGDETTIPPLVREQAYLVMREAVRNAVAHSGCKRVGVSVEVDGGELRVRVEDDGEGFEPGEGSIEGEEGGPTAGVGLRSMRERTEMLDGRLEISSKPGRGTAVEVGIPLVD